MKDFEDFDKILLLEKHISNFFQSEMYSLLYFSFLAHSYMALKKWNFAIDFGSPSRDLNWDFFQPFSTKYRLYNLFLLLFQVGDSDLIRYLPEKSIENPGLVSATLGLSFQIDESHFAPRARLASDGSTLMRSQEKELWALCEATMPPIEGTTFPFTREVYLGSLSQTFDHFQSDANGLLCKFCLSTIKS